MSRDIPVELGAAVVRGMRAYGARPDTKLVKPDVVEFVVEQLLPLAKSIGTDVDIHHRANLRSLENTVRAYAATAPIPEARDAYRRVAGLLAELCAAELSLHVYTTPPHPRKD